VTDCGGLSWLAFYCTLRTHLSYRIVSYRIVSYRVSVLLSCCCLVSNTKEAQLSQRGCTILRVIEYFAKSLNKVIRNNTLEYTVGQSTLWLWFMIMCNPITLCLTKVGLYPLMLDNNFGKCGPLFKILSPIDSQENSLYRPTPQRCHPHDHLHYVATLPREIWKFKNVTNWYLIQFSIDYHKKFLNWRKTSCVVSITTVSTWHTWTADLSADFEQRIIDRAIKKVTKRLWGCVNADTRHSNTCCSCWYC